MDNLFIALLRAVNVGGKNSIKMIDLRKVLSQNNYMDIQTYIQSGNIIFKHKEKDKEKISQNLHEIIKQNFNLDIPVFVYSYRDFLELTATNPFNEESKTEPTKVLVSFILKTPATLNYKEVLNGIVYEQYVTKTNYIFIYCPLGYGKSKLNNNYIEKKLKVKATTRNWKTILKILEILNK